VNFEIKVQYTAEKLREIMKDFYWASCGTWIVISTLALVFGICGLVIWNWDLIAWVMVILSAGYLLQLERSYSTSVRESSFARDVTISFNDDGIFYTTRFTTYSCQWGAIVGATLYKKTLILYVDPSEQVPLMLPRRDLGQARIDELLSKIGELGLQIRKNQGG
jgi:hypothetical protein